MFDEAIWADVSERVERRALRSVGNVADAKDLAQETVRVALLKDGLSTRADLISFCLGVLKRQVSNYYRRRRYWRMVPLGWAHDLSAKADPSSALADREVVQRTAEMVRRLRFEDRRLLKLMLSGCPRSQMAESLGLTRPLLRQRYHRLIQKLKRWSQKGVHRLGDVA